MAVGVGKDELSGRAADVMYKVDPLSILVYVEAVGCATVCCNTVDSTRVVDPLVQLV